jgi:hypothetical protein
MTPEQSGGSIKIVPGRARNGDAFFSVLAKRSYAIRPGRPAERRGQDAPLRLVDSYYDGGDPDWSVVEHESETAPLKAATDVAVIAQAYAPGGQATAQMVVGVKLGEHKKVLRVTGDRRCQWREGAPPVFTEPEPFTTMPIRYDRAYGGRDEASDPNLPFFYPRNDKGRGVALRNLKAAVQDLPLPNIEEPADLLTPERVVIDDPRRWPDQPLPQGFGWRQRTWYPRCALLGAWPPFLDAGTVTAEERMGLLPSNHVALAKQMRLPPYLERFANGASLGLVIDDVAGNEPVALRGLTPDGALDFELPGDVLAMTLDLGKGECPLKAKIHTISIRPDEMALDIVWHGALPFGPYAKLGSLTRLEAHVT